MYDSSIGFGGRGVTAYAVTIVVSALGWSVLYVVLDRLMRRDG